jgi:hypothetical protein
MSDGRRPEIAVMRFALAARKGNSSESMGWWEFYRSNIAGSCKNNIQIKNQKKIGNYEPNQTNKWKTILGKTN